MMIRTTTPMPTYIHIFFLPATDAGWLAGAGAAGAGPAGAGEAAGGSGAGVGGSDVAGGTGWVGGSAVGFIFVPLINNPILACDDNAYKT
jgi:hypothetical protein